MPGEKARRRLLEQLESVSFLRHAAHEKSTYDMR